MTDVRCALGTGFASTTLLAFGSERDTFFLLIVFPYCPVHYLRNAGLQRTSNLRYEYPKERPSFDGPWLLLLSFETRGSLRGLLDYHACGASPIVDDRFNRRRCDQTVLVDGGIIAQAGLD